MKKSSFITLILGTVSGVLFSLGMCMALLPEWNLFGQGIIFGAVGLVLGLITFLVWCKMENVKLPKFFAKGIFKLLFGILGVVVFGIGICLCLVGNEIIWGTLVGLAGIVMLISLIPIIKGIK